MKWVFYKLSKHHSGKGQSQKIILVRLNESVVGFQMESSKRLLIGTITPHGCEKTSQRCVNSSDGLKLAMCETVCVCLCVCGGGWGCSGKSCVGNSELFKTLLFVFADTWIIALPYLLLVSQLTCKISNHMCDLSGESHGVEVIQDGMVKSS